MTLANQIALVSGASRGIGKAIALELGHVGATVAGTATGEQGVASINEYLNAEGIKGCGLIMDVTKPEQIGSCIDAVAEQFGVISILVNNAGITKDNLLMRMKDEQWDAIINTNLTSIYRLCRACINPMVKARYGRIISISSVVGVAGNAGQSNYAAAKAGLIGFSKSLAREVGARGITVNAVAPGFIDTDMTRDLREEQKQQLLAAIPLNRLGQVKEIAAAVGFLASAEASYITGQTLHVNGGMYMA